MTALTASKLVAGGGIISFILSIYFFYENKPMFAALLLGGALMSYVLFKTPKLLLIKSADEIDQFIPELQKDPNFYLGLALMIVPGAISLLGYFKTGAL
ncbi:hypothetical protein [Alkalimarinus coralli]|uniref:hypothetical protein n=1 Tax=Alkalimarinus coralli TaxID=2935863 RepID=UPI00202AC358|nr:hypothetical protein [Alkalimarinus coralli]